jgi:hypothetical protein
LSRERRKERREAANAAISELRAIESAAIHFHTAEKFDSLVISDLTSKVQRWIKLVQRQPLNHMDIPIGRLVRLRRAITLANADLTEFTSQTSGSELILGIRTAVDELIDAIEQGRETKFA